VGVSVISVSGFEGSILGEKIQKALFGLFLFAPSIVHRQHGSVDVRGGE
jgi:hypothetical protein